GVVLDLHVTVGPQPGHQDHRRAVALDRYGVAGLEAADDRLAVGEEDAGPVVHQDGAVDAGRQVTLSVARNGVRYPHAILPLTGGDLGPVADRKGPRRSARDRHVAGVHRAPAAARVTVAVEVAEDRRGPRVGTVEARSVLDDGIAAGRATGGD